MSEFDLECPYCKHVFKPGILNEFSICPKCGKRFRSCQSRCEFADANAYYCIDYCPFAAEDRSLIVDDGYYDPEYDEVYVGS